MDLKQLPDLIENELWHKPINQRAGWQRPLVHTGRMAYGVVRMFTGGKFNMRAMSLVYTTLLSIVPLLAVSFAVLRAFGVHNQLEPTLLSFLEPLGDRKEEVVAQVVQFVENLRLGVLSSLGMVMLIYTVVAMTHKVEQAFNDIWRVSTPRSLARRFSDYLSVILIGPVLIFSGLSQTRSAMDSEAIKWLVSVEPFGTLLYGISLMVPYILVCAAFSFLYGFVPNTRVKLSAAVVGGVFTGVLWSAASVIFATLVVRSGNYSAIYAGFASVVLFMVWLYLGWLIILIGGQVAFYWQYPRFLDPRTENPHLSSREREEVAIELMALIAGAHYNHQPLCTFETLEAQRQDLQPDTILHLLDLLEEKGLILVTGSNPESFLPARRIEQIYLQDILLAVRGQDHIKMPSLPKVTGIMNQIDDAISNALENKTLLDLIEETPAPAREALSTTAS